MLIDFNSIAEESRIWIYASEQRLTNKSEFYIHTTISNFLKNWESHKVPLISAVTILHNHFIVVAVDESKHSASGCSIDSLQNILQSLEKKLLITLMNRLNVYCKIDNDIKCMDLNNLSGIEKDTLFFDLTIKTKRNLNNWLKPIEQGWCHSYL